jgi:putative DNA methylase
MPLASSFVFSEKNGNKTFVQPYIDGKQINYEVKIGKNAPKAPKIGKGVKFSCICCSESTTHGYIKSEAVSGRMGASLMAIVAKGKNGRVYCSPNAEHVSVAINDKPENFPTGELSDDKRHIGCKKFGLDTFDKLFTNRQLTTVTIISELLTEVYDKILTDGATGAYAKAIMVYLSFVLDKIAVYNNITCTWDKSRESIRSPFIAQGIPMTWDYAEANPFSSSTGSYDNMLNLVVKSMGNLPASANGYALQHDAQSDNGLRNIMVSTDPPYYDNIGYADVSDFFYIWLRKSLKNFYPDIFETMLVPKAEELVVVPHRFDGNKGKAKIFFENGMLSACKKIYICANDNIPITIYYAFKQGKSDKTNFTASTGWETVLSAIIQAGFSITGTWPIKTEQGSRPNAKDTNALSTSIVIVCRKRPADAPKSTRRDFLNELKRELKPALRRLQASNIAPVDLAQSAIGPGMGVYSRFSSVLEADGKPLGVRSALQIINEELDRHFQDGEFDSDSRFCIALYKQCAFKDISYGEADVLARAKNASINRLQEAGVLYAAKGVVRLLTRDEIFAASSTYEKKRQDGVIIWLLTQQLTRALDKDGVDGAAKIVVNSPTSAPYHAKDLAYHLFTLADRKGLAAEALAYNSLVVAWPEVQSKAAELLAAANRAKPRTLFDH